MLKQTTEIQVYGPDTETFNYQKQLALGAEAIARAKRIIDESSERSRYRDTLVDPMEQSASVHLGCFDAEEGGPAPTKRVGAVSPGEARMHGVGRHPEEKIGHVISNSAQSKPTEGHIVKSPECGDPNTGLTVATADRRTEVNDFLVRCNRESAVGFKVIRKHIWLGVGHTRARQFEHWQGNSESATSADARNFHRILRRVPAEFIALLKREGIFASSS